MRLRRHTLRFRSLAVSQSLLDLRIFVSIQRPKSRVVIPKLYEDSRSRRQCFLRATMSSTIKSSRYQAADRGDRITTKATRCQDNALTTRTWGASAGPRHHCRIAKTACRQAQESNEEKLVCSIPLDISRSKVQVSYFQNVPFIVLSQIPQ